MWLVLYLVRHRRRWDSLSEFVSFCWVYPALAALWLATVATVIQKKNWWTLNHLLRVNLARGVLIHHDILSWCCRNFRPALWLMHCLPKAVCGLASAATVLVPVGLLMLCYLHLGSVWPYSHLVKHTELTHSALDNRWLHEAQKASSPSSSPSFVLLCMEHLKQFSGVSGSG